MERLRRKCTQKSTEEEGKISLKLKIVASLRVKVNGERQCDVRADLKVRDGTLRRWLHHAMIDKHVKAVGASLTKVKEKASHPKKQQINDAVDCHLMRMNAEMSTSSMKYYEVTSKQVETVFETERQQSRTYMQEFLDEMSQVSGFDAESFDFDSLSPHGELSDTEEDLLV